MAQAPSDLLTHQMKLLVADIRQERSLREVIGLLEYILEHRAELPDL